jgi:hypothetical protein
VNGALGMSRGWVCLLVLAASLGVAGCNSSTGDVSGKVYFGDVVVKGGMVTFFCADGRGIPTEIREDGSYTVSQVPIGKAKVCVDTSSLDPKRRKPYTYSPPAGRDKDPPGFSQPSPGVYVAIPGKYAAAATTDLTCEVAGGSQWYDIKMK